MENASKALIMAGGVLIAVAIITLAIYTYSYYKEYARSSEQMLTLSQIESFNRFYESYQSSTNSTGTIDGKSTKFYLIRGIDYLNIYKKAKEDNLLDESFQIKEEDHNYLNEISSDSSKFVGTNYYCGFRYDENGKIGTVYLRKNLP